MHRLFSQNVIRSTSIFSGAFGATLQNRNPMAFSIRSYTPAHPEGAFPYTEADLTPTDAGNDEDFYLPSRFVTHIDDNAIINLKRYYQEALPRGGRILDFCSSWISHYPPDVEAAVQENVLEVLGTGMNQDELRKNPVLKSWNVQNLNEDPDIKLPGPTGGAIDASTCVVSIDYLTKPLEVLRSIRQHTKQGGTVHLAISNRCFPTKAVRRWLQVDENERLHMVGDYLHWAGWQRIEIITLVEPGSWLKDPLWVVRATKDI